MWKCLLAVGILALLFCSPAMAGKNANGALVVHTNDANNYTGIGLCTRFETVDNPGTCENAGVISNKDGATPALVWLLAAFAQGSNPGVVVIYFGLNHNLPVGLGYFDRWGFCGPAGSLEIPDAGWPEVGGNSVAFGTPIVGDILFPYYFFNVYGDPGSFLGTGINPTGGYAAFVDDSNPPVQDNITLFGNMAWGTPGHNDCPVFVALEACCFADGTCQDLSAEDCTAAGGTPEGAGTDCATFQCPPPPPETGACCFPNGSCQDLTLNDCTNGGGTYEGDQTECATFQCPQPPELGACCFPNGSCQDMTADGCATAGGTYEGDQTECATFQCPQPPELGACCFPNGSCQDLTADNCASAGGTFEGDQTECATFQCPQPPELGACCFADGSCQDLTAENCANGGGTYEGDQTDCATFQCPPPAELGACCFADGSCQDLTAENCGNAGGTYEGDQTDCATFQCPPPPPEAGACCYPNGSCAVVLQDICQTEGGTFQGEGTTCDGVECPQPAPEFIRGDVNASGALDILDVFGCMISSVPREHACRDAADYNDSGTIDRNDCVEELYFLFGNGDPPPPPYPDCGIDPTEDGLDCASFPPCSLRTVGPSGSVRVVSERLPIGSIRLDAQLAADGSTVSIPVVLDAGAGLSAFELSARYDPSVLRFQGIGSAGARLDYVSAQEKSGGALRVGGVVDLELETALASGAQTIGQLIFRVTKPEAVEGSEVEVTGGVLIAKDGAASEIPSASARIVRTQADQPGLMLKPGFSLPNPIRPNGAIALDLPEASQVRLDVYSVNGQRIRTLVASDLPKGRHEVRWDGRTESGQDAAPGIYYLRATVGTTQIVKKVALVR